MKNKNNTAVIKQIIKYVVLGNSNTYVSCKDENDSVEKVTFNLSTVFPNKEEEEKFLKSYEKSQLKN